MLLAIGTYMKQRHVVSLDEMAQHFHVSTSALEGMLEHWLVRGCLKQWTKSGCGGCTHCPPEQMEMYQWVAPEPVVLC